MMDEENLSDLTVGELLILCRNRDLDTNKRVNKQRAIKKIISYHKQNGIKKLEFNEWKKDQLITEAKIIGLSNITSKTKSAITDLIKKEHSKKEKRMKKIKNSKRGNKHKKSTKNHLFQTQKNVISRFGELENVLIDVFNALKLLYKPLNDEVGLPHDFTEYDDFPTIPDRLLDAMDEFGDKILTLFPLFLEAQSMVNDFVDYNEKVQRFKKQKSKKKQTYYIGMKKYKRKKDYNEDPNGPIVCVMDSIKGFDEWAKQKKIRKKFGKKIKRIRYVAHFDDKKKKKKEERKINDKMEESDFSEVDIDDMDVSEEEKESVGGANEERIPSLGELLKDDQSDSEGTESNEDIDIDIDVDGNKQTEQMKTTRSRRKRKRQSAENEEEDGNARKKAKVSMEGSFNEIPMTPALI